eukprot:c9308_g1_i1.p1 GENE.c9308_g1_i1~~c9308_g1_i1.p1  ORF type:complete len:261 (+),score=60.26 c9308_g1_i1:43-783(+)
MRTMYEFDFPALGGETKKKTNKSVGQVDSDGPAKVDQERLTQTKAFSDFRLLLRPHQNRTMRRNLQSQTIECMYNQFEPFSNSPTTMRLSEQATRMRGRKGVGRGLTAAWSEALSFEMLHRLFDAKLLQTEHELAERNVVADYLCEVYDLPVLVSVTRAYKPNSNLTSEECLELLQRKIRGLVKSNQILSPPAKVMVHVWASDLIVATRLQAAVAELTNDFGGLVVMITATVFDCKLDHSFIFGNQ